jgi:phospholipase/lecithinase/hemolysin
MKEKRNRSCVVLLCLYLAFPIGAAADDGDRESFSNIFVFGNSLSDTGNAAQVRNFFLPQFDEPNLCNLADALPPPFVRRGCGDLFFEETRVSNGRVAVEVSTRRLGLGELKPSLHLLFPFIGIPESTGTNFAVAGATARGTDPIDLPVQVQGFSIRHAAVPFDDLEDALYVVMIGGNDVIDAVQAAAERLAGSTPDEAPQAIIADAVDAIGDNIELLIGQGARKILVVNAPNIGSIPATRIEAEEEGVPPAFLIGLATLLTKKFNRQLAGRIDQVRATQQQIDDLEIREFNLFRFFRGVRLVGRLFGLNVVDPCFDREAYLDDEDGLIAERVFDPDCAPGPGEAPKFDRFVFFDDIHPTGLVHGIVGKAIAAATRKLSD